MFLFLYLSYFPDQMDCILLKNKHVIEVTVYVKHNKHLLHFNFLLMKVKEESEKIGLILNIHKTKIMASGPITSWEIDGETVETVSPETLQIVTAAMKLKDAYSLEGKL